MDAAMIKGCNGATKRNAEAAVEFQQVLTAAVDEQQTVDTIGWRFGTGHVLWETMSEM